MRFYSIAQRQAVLASLHALIEHIEALRRPVHWLFELIRFRRPSLTNVARFYQRPNQNIISNKEKIVRRNDRQSELLTEFFFLIRARYCDRQGLSNILVVLVIHRTRVVEPKINHGKRGCLLN